MLYLYCEHFQVFNALSVKRKVWKKEETAQTVAMCLSYYVRVQVQAFLNSVDVSVWDLGSA